MPKSSPLPTVTLRGVEIFGAGTWKDMSGHVETFTEEDLDAMVNTFQENQERYRPFLKIGHKDKSRYQDDPAFGQMTNLRRAGKKLLADFAQVPAKLGQLIVSGAFPNRSAEILKTPQIGGKVWPWAVKAVALLGAAHPALDNLQAITDLYQAPEVEGEAYGFTDHDGTQPHLTFEAVTGSEAPGKGDPTKTDGGTEMSETKVKELEGTLEAERAAKAATEKENEDLKAKLHKQAEDQRAREIQHRVDTGKSALEAAFKSGKLAPVTRSYMEQIVKIVAEHDTVLSFSAEKDGKPEDLTGIQIFEKMLEVAPSGLKFGKQDSKATGEERNTGNSDPMATVDARAREYMRDLKQEMNGAHYQAAVEHVLREDPELAEQYGRPSNL